MIRTNKQSACFWPTALKARTTNFVSVPAVLAALVFIGAMPKTLFAQATPTLNTVLAEDFTDGLPPNGDTWSYQVGGKIEHVDGGVRMTDVEDGGAASLNEMIVHVNLAGVRDATVRFDLTDLRDEETKLLPKYDGSKNGDGVSVSSNNGLSWITVQTWDRSINTSGNYSISLKEYVAEHDELGFTDDFLIKFQQWDDYAERFDGRIYDNIQVQVETDCGEVEVIGDFEITGAADPQILLLASATNIHGSVSIQYTDDITDLSFLANLQCIDTITLWANEGLKTLNGLEKLHTVRKELSLNANPALDQIASLGNLSYATEIRITSTDVLESLHGLEGLEYLGTGGLTLFRANGLKNLQGLSNLKAVQGQIRIDQMENLSSLDGLGVLVEAGSIKIADNDNEDFISLAPLQGIERLTGNIGLVITGNKNITTLEGIGSLTVKALWISETKLANLQGLEDVVVADSGEVTISDNELLTSLHGLSSVQTLSTLRVIDNDNLPDLQGLEGLNVVSDYLRLRGEFDSVEGLNELHTVDRLNMLSAEIETLSALAKLSTLGDISINGRKLTNLNGLQGIAVARRVLVWDGGDLFTSLHGLDNLQEVESISILSCPKIVDLDPLSSLTKAQRIVLTDNDELKDIRALSGIEKLEAPEEREENSSQGYLIVSNNPKLASLEGLHNIVRARRVSIERNHSVVDLRGLRGFESVDEDLHIGKKVVFGIFPHEVILYRGNDALGSLDGLQKLRFVGGEFHIVGNPSLAGLAGIVPEQLVIGGDIRIERNIANNIPALSSCEVEAFVDSLSSIGGAVHVSHVEKDESCD